MTTEEVNARENYVTLVADNEFEINSEYPHQTRRISDQRIMNTFSNSNGYQCVSLNGKIHEYTYVDSISDEAIVVNDYGRHRFEFYYYDPIDDEFYYFNGRQYRQLHVNEMKLTGALYVQMMDATNRKRSIYINKFKKLYGIDY
ncbi:MAG: hypothetical protein EZS28_015791 [Streblomastix strix]|uniref:Uncharacterized protein n=1 Tax=Streblomastix strix TaxID=222440 RepID=A0A5J4W1G0_9EUKA|nr:MAG: hypothetical protein EZS28_015791 [Streblomastix strix]